MSISCIGSNQTTQLRKQSCPKQQAPPHRTSPAGNPAIAWSPLPCFLQRAMLDLARLQNNISVHQFHYSGPRWKQVDKRSTLTEEHDHSCDQLCLLRTKAHQIRPCLTKILARRTPVKHSCDIIQPRYYQTANVGIVEAPGSTPRTVDCTFTDCKSLQHALWSVVMCNYHM